MNRPKLSGISVKVLDAYILWHKTTKHIPKMLRYSLGVRIDSLFAEVVEYVSEAMFNKGSSRAELIEKAIKKNDVLKFMLYALLELDGISEKHFMAVSDPLEDAGRMLFGWRNKERKKSMS